MMCKTCRFWSRVEAIRGKCMRFPPTGAQWSETMEDDWCGEYSRLSENARQLRSDIEFDEAMHEVK